MRLALLVFLAGGVGTLLRFALVRWVGTHAAGEFPWGTLTVNCLGSLACGAAYGIMQARGVSSEWRVVVLVGFLGALTTFSALALESVSLVRDDKLGVAIANLLAANLGGIACLVVGLMLARVLAPG